MRRPRSSSNKHSTFQRNAPQRPYAISGITTLFFQKSLFFEMPVFRHRSSQLSAAEISQVVKERKETGKKYSDVLQILMDATDEHKSSLNSELIEDETDQFGSIVNKELSSSLKSK
ncbi:hypothetical protein TNIN_175751, partial [Trichonephila inaurata madagascariensis]